MKLSTSSRIDGVDLRDDRATETGAVLQQVVHDQRAEDQAAGQADQCLDAGDHLRDEALGDRRGRLLDRRPGFVQRGLIDIEVDARVLQRRVDRGTDLIPLRDDAPRGCHQDDGHQGDQPKDDQAGGEGGLEPAALELPDKGLEDHGEDGREEEREHNLAHRAQGDDDDGRRHHETYEAPSPDSEFGNRAQAFRHDCRLLRSTIHAPWEPPPAPHGPLRPRPGGPWSAPARRSGSSLRAELR